MLALGCLGNTALAGEPDRRSEATHGGGQGSAGRAGARDLPGSLCSGSARGGPPSAPHPAAQHRTAPGLPSGPRGGCGSPHHPDRPGPDEPDGPDSAERRLPAEGRRFIADQSLKKEQSERPQPGEWEGGTGSCSSGPGAAPSPPRGVAAGPRGSPWPSPRGGAQSSGSRRPARPGYPALPGVCWGLGGGSGHPGAQKALPKARASAPQGEEG